MAVVPGDVLRTVVTYALPGGSTAQLVWHYLCSAGSSATPAQCGITIAAAYAAAWNQVKAHIATNVTSELLELYQYDFTLHRFDGIYTAVLAGADGTGSGESSPHGAAGLGKIITDVARRQARKYLFGFIEGSSGDGNLIATAATAFGLFLADLDASLAPGGVALDFGTFNVDDASPLYESFSSAVGSTIAETVMAYQRRRRPGTGI